MSPLFTFRFDIEKSHRTYDVLVIFVATATLDPNAFATAVQDEIEMNLVPDELLIVVRDIHSEKIENELKNDSLHQATIARLHERCTVSLSTYGYHGQEIWRAHIDGPTAQQKVEFEDFRRRGITNIFNTRHGFVESTATYHFENPSRRHTERFIRLSNILARGAEISFIGFCALPMVPKLASIVYIDTPSLYAVVAAINEQRVSFGCEPLIVDNFGSYSGVNDYNFQKADDSFVLISASSSGSLAGLLKDDLGFSSPNISHLLFLGEDKSGSQIVCDLQFDEHENPEGVDSMPAVETADGCRMCASGSFPIKLQGDQFEFAGPQQEPLLILEKYKPDNLDKLMCRTAGEKIFGVGVGTARQSRQFDINPEKLLVSNGFEERLDYALRRSLPASLSHVIALDTASMPLAEKVANLHTDEPRTVLDRNDVKKIPNGTSSAVAIVGSVIESGRSLLDISRDLRSIVPKAPLLYIVGFSKSTGEQLRNSLAKTLEKTLNQFPYQLIEIENMVLPSSRENRSWVDELNLWRNPNVLKHAPYELHATIENRANQLRKTSVPIHDNLFLRNAPNMAFELQPGFVFWSPNASMENYSEADVFFTIASVLQQLRANPHLPDKKGAIKTNRFQQTILAPENFGRYNDDIIQASILRAAYPREMNFADSPNDSREMGRLIHRIINSSSAPRGGAAAEFLIAIATNRLRLCSSDRDEVLKAKNDKSVFIDFLQRYCRSCD